MQQGWFVAINQIINNISVLAIFLTGAAVLREREHGTLEHLLVMPLQPYELMFAKIWANGLVVMVAVMASLYLVVKGALGVPVAGSIPLFFLGLVVYLFSVTALGIMLATMVRSMPQFGLLAFPVFIVMSLLSGGQTPLESMPIALQKIMQVRAVDALCELFPGGAVPQRGPEHGVAGSDEDVLDWIRIHVLYAFQIPQDAHRDSVTGVTRGYAHVYTVDGSKIADGAGGGMHHGRLRRRGPGLQTAGCRADRRVQVPGRSVGGQLDRGFAVVERLQ